MGLDLYLLPKATVGSDPVNARDWLARENHQFTLIPGDRDPTTETRKRTLADILLKMKPAFKEFDIQFAQIAAFEKISVDEARRKYRHIEINGPGVQFMVFDQYVGVGVYSKIDLDELDAVLATLSAEGGFVLFNPQSDEVIDLSKESLA